MEYDLIITGRQAIDGDTAQVGPQIAEHLGIPNISYAEEIRVEGDSVIVKRQYEDRYHMIKAKMPCLITALSELNTPRYMTPGGIFDAYAQEVKVLGRKDIEIDDTNIGLKGSPTRVSNPSPKRSRARVPSSNWILRRPETGSSNGFKKNSSCRRNKGDRRI